MHKAEARASGGLTDKERLALIGVVPDGANVSSGVHSVGRIPGVSIRTYQALAHRGYVMCRPGYWFEGAGVADDVMVAGDGLEVAEQAAANAGFEVARQEAAVGVHFLALELVELVQLCVFNDVIADNFQLRDQHRHGLSEEDLVADPGLERLAAALERRTQEPAERLALAQPLEQVFGLQDREDLDIFLVVGHRHGCVLAVSDGRTGSRPEHGGVK
jgi:hypothetical protein